MRNIVAELHKTAIDYYEHGNGADPEAIFAARVLNNANIGLASWVEWDKAK